MDEYKKKISKENKKLWICKIFPISAYLGFIGIFLNIIVYFYIGIVVMVVLGKLGIISNVLFLQQFCSF